MTLYEQVRGALDAAGIDLPAAALDRAAAVTVAELTMASTAPHWAAVTGADWVTIKARADAGSETVGTVKRGAEVLVGQPERSWRPLYGMPLGWVSANLVT